MKPAPFTYFAPETLDEALALRAEHAGDCVVLSGGQSLVPILSLRLAQPAVVIDVNRIPGLDGIAERNGGIAIGARARQRQAERSSLVAEKAPLLAKALPLIAHPAIRNRGTIGGSIAHADPAAELPAVALALDAELVATSTARGERSIPASEFFYGFLSTALESDEILTEIRLEAPKPGTGVAFQEVARNHGAFALVGAGAQVTVSDGTVTEARIVVIGAGGTAVRARAAESGLAGQPASPASFAEAAAASVVDLDPVSDVHASADYRRRVAQVLVRRVLTEAAEVAS